MIPRLRVSALAALVSLGAGCAGAAAPQDTPSPGPIGGLATATAVASSHDAQQSSKVSVSEIVVSPVQEQAADKPPPPPPPPPDPGPFPHGKDPKPPQAAQTANNSGRLSAESVEAAVGASGDLLGRCTTEYATVSARILVSGNGQVLEAAVGQSTPDDARMRDCVVSALKKMKFASTSDASTPLSFRLAINPASELR